MKSKKLELLLEKSEEARNCTSRKLEELYLLEYVCKNRQEHSILQDIYSKKFPSGASLKRIRADFQNKQGLYKPSKEIQKKRNKYRHKIQKEFRTENIFSAMYRYFIK